MMHIKTILWPTDISSTPQTVIDAVVALAKQFHAKIHVLHAIAPVPILPASASAIDAISHFDVNRYENELILSTEKSLSAIIDTHIPRTVESEPHIAVGHPRDAILDFVQNNEVDVIVMATHGRSGIDRLLIGSVAESAIRHSPVPLFIIPFNNN